MTIFLETPFNLFIPSSIKGTVIDQEKDLSFLGEMSFPAALKKLIYLQNFHDWAHFKNEIKLLHPKLITVMDVKSKCTYICNMYYTVTVYILYAIRD